MSGLADRSVIKAAVALVAFGGLSACATASDDLPDGAGRASGVATITRSLSDAGLARYVADMDLAMLAVARRHDPRPHKDYWGRVRGWEKLDLHRIPRLGDREPDFEEARAINAFKASSPIAMQAAEPFVISGPTAERNKALRCLTQAVYFESGFERLEGQQAVAQTVLNRVRHPGYPKSICGVVYEGAARGSGCQFSFTCDGSLARAISPAVWSNAEIVAKRALAGFVAKDVGTATHYHADYVYPYWAPTLVKLRTVGAHVFYRWTGPSGQVSAFRGRYSPHEDVSAEIMMGADPRTLEAAPPDILAQARAETLSAQAASLAAAQASGAAPTPTGAAATINHDGVVEILPPLSGDAAMAMRGGRRAPTAEEIARINKALESVPEVAAEPARPSEPTSPTPAAPRKKSSS